MNYQFYNEFLMRNKNINWMDLLVVYEKALLDMVLIWSELLIFLFTAAIIFEHVDY